MNIITEPRYQSFNGLLYQTEKQCTKAEQEFKKDVFQMFKDLITGCQDQKNCESCPFYKETEKKRYCFIEEITRLVPTEWDISGIEEEE